MDYLLPYWSHWRTGLEPSLVICAYRTVNQIMITILEGVAITGKAGVDILTARETALSVVPLMIDLRFGGLLCVSRSPL